MRLPAGNCCSGGNTPRLGSPRASSRGEPPKSRQMRGYSLLKRASVVTSICCKGFRNAGKSSHLRRSSGRKSRRRPRRVVNHRGWCAQERPIPTCRSQAREPPRQHRISLIPFSSAKNEILAPFNRLFVKKALDAVARKTAIKLFDKSLILAAITEEDFIHPAFPLILVEFTSRALHHRFPHVDGAHPASATDSPAPRRSRQARTA